jgi:hypothetical protein
LLVLSLAHAQHKHVHGEGKLDVAIDKDIITLNLELPLDVAVGFERPPKNEKEKLLLADAEKVLKDANALWTTTSAARCALRSAEVGMPKFTGGEHADVDARYVFRCANPVVLKSVETSLFKHFKRLYRLETQRVGPTGQGAQRLSPQQPILVW